MRTLPNRLALASSLGCALAACGGGTSGSSGTAGFANDVQQVAQAAPLYSISFGDQGTFLLTLFAATTPALTCSALESSPSLPLVLEVATPLASGTYPVGPSNSSQYPPTASGQSANVVFRSQPKGALKASMTLPTAGQVVVGTAPADTSGQLGGGHVSGSFHLGFPADPMQPAQCHGTTQHLPDGGVIQANWYCVCNDFSGKTVSVCDGGVESQCCLSSEQASVFVDGTFDAQPCGVVCIDPAGAGGCAPLRPHG